MIAIMLLLLFTGCQTSSRWVGRCWRCCSWPRRDAVRSRNAPNTPPTPQGGEKQLDCISNKQTDSNNIQTDTPRAPNLSCRFPLPGGLFVRREVRVHITLSLSLSIYIYIYIYIHISLSLHIYIYIIASADG